MICSKTIVVFECARLMDIISTCTCPFNGAFSLWLSFIKLQVKHALDRKIPKTPKEKHRAYKSKRTDNTMAKPNMTKGQITINNTLHRKLRIEQQKPQ